MTPADLAFAWTLYRGSMKPLTEEILVWNDAQQMRVVERDVVSGEASVIMRGREPIGWLRARETAAEVELLQLYVAPDARNRGVGTAIVRGLMADAVRKDKAVTLQVLRNNSARSLYTRLGFARTGEDNYKLHMTWRGESGGQEDA